MRLAVQVQHPAVRVVGQARLISLGGKQGRILVGERELAAVGAVHAPAVGAGPRVGRVARLRAGALFGIEQRHRGQRQHRGRGRGGLREQAGAVPFDQAGVQVGV